MAAVSDVIPSSGSTIIPSCVTCSQVNNRKGGRSCSSCNNYYHLTCVGLTRKNSSSLNIWKCSVCLDINASSSNTLTKIPDLPRQTDFLIKARKTCRIPIKIPKPARITAADALSNTIDEALTSEDTLAWQRLHEFALRALGVNKFPQENTSPSLASAIKSSISDFLHRIDPQHPITVPSPPTHSQSSNDEPRKLRQRVNNKFMEGDVRAAVRLVASDDSIVEPNEEVLSVLRLKHPPAPTDIRSLNPSSFNNPDCLCHSQFADFSEADVLAAIRSFPASSSGGVDGLRPGHLRDLVAKQTAEAGRRLLTSITALCRRFAHGDLPLPARDMFFSASLTALKKKDGGIRPIAVGNVFRRLASKLVCRPAVRRLADELRPIQLGVGIAGGCESAAHAVRQYVHSRPQRGDVLVKLDVSNAFNSIRRDHLLETCQSRAPELLNLAHLAYGKPSSLYIGENVIPSASGVQQGDPLGPLLFALGVDHIARSVSSPINIWYLDDATIGGPPDVVVRDLEKIIPKLAEIGLHINSAKSEIINISQSEEGFSKALAEVKKTLCEVRVTPPEALTVLGSPIHSEAIVTSLRSKHSRLEQMVSRLKMLNAHPALFLLRHCLSLPRLLFLLRSSPCFELEEEMSQLDATICLSLEEICNVSIDDNGWKQASLPIRHGGLSIRAPSDVALPAYLASLNLCQPLIDEILNSFSSLSNECKSKAIHAWKSKHSSPPPTPGTQRSLDDALCRTARESLRTVLDQHRLACLAAASSPHSGDWLKAFPSSATGTMLDDACLRVAICQRLGLRVCEPHPCRCGLTVDGLGLHPLSCRMSAGRIPRHAALNDIVRRGLTSAGIPSILEPVGLDRGDGKRPDGITIFPYRHGRCLVWDATCTDTFSQRALVPSATQPGTAANAAEEKKVEKYRELSNRYLFTPIAVETAGVIGSRSLPFLRGLASRIATARDDPREAPWLFQRISLAIIRGNAFSVLSAGRGRTD